jgi:hypothetical protein
MNFTIEDHFPQKPERVVQGMLDAPLQRTIHVDELDYERWEELERAPEGEGLVRVLAVTPKVALPGFIKSAFGDSTGYRERQVWAADRRSYDWSAEFELSSLVEMTGTCRFTPEGAGTLRTIEATCKVGVPLLGGKIEKYLRGETEEAQHRSAEALAEQLGGGQ